MSAPGYPGASGGGNAAGEGYGSASSSAPPGHVRVHSLSELLRAGVPGAAQRDAKGPGASYLDALVGLGGEKEREKETFPPLINRNPSVSSLARFAEGIVSQTKHARAETSAAAGSARDPDPDPAGDDGAALLWGVLRAMSARGGGLAGENKAAGADPAGENKAAGADVRALLLGEDASGVSPLGPGTRAFSFAETSAADVPFESSFRPTNADDGAVDGAVSAVALAESERLLLSGRRRDALEVLARAGLWAQASLLASRMGAAFQRDVAARAARASTAEGSPMRTLALVLAGAASDLLQADDPGAVPVSSAERSNEKKAFKRDDARGLLPRWREHLTILAANASLAPEESRRVMAALGDALLASSRESFHETKDSGLFNAHAAFALAGIAPQPFHPAARLCLLGADHARAPRTYHSDPRAIQATALLERAVCGASSSSGVSGSNPAFSTNVCFASFQPYKVHYAGLLAEVGATREALALAESVSKTLRSREFLACASSRDGSVNVAMLTQLAGEMEHRLRGNARGTLGGLSLRDLGSAATTLFGGFGKMFDKGVQKVFGDEGVNGVLEGNGGSVVGRLVSHSRTHSSASSASNDKAFVAFGDKTGDKAFENTFDAGGTGGRQGGAFGVGNGGASSAAAGSAAHSRTASFASDASASAADPGASPSSSAPKGSGSVWRQFSGVLGKVGAAIPLPKPKNQAKLGEENTMYYDEKLGRWVEPGKEGEADAGPPPPPPTTLGASPAAGTGHPAASPGTGASPGTAAAAPCGMRAQKGRSKYGDACSLSGPPRRRRPIPGRDPGRTAERVPRGDHASRRRHLARLVPARCPRDVLGRRRAVRDPPRGADGPVAGARLREAGSRRGRDEGPRAAPALADGAFRFFFGGRKRRPKDFRDAFFVFERSRTRRRDRRS